MEKTILRTLKADLHEYLEADRNALRLNNKYINLILKYSI